MVNLKFCKGKKSKGVFFVLLFESYGTQVSCWEFLLLKLKARFLKPNYIYFALEKSYFEKDSSNEAEIFGFVVLSKLCFTENISIQGIVSKLCIETCVGFSESDLTDHHFMCFKLFKNLSDS